jgi:hypothetical protein
MAQPVNQAHARTAAPPRIRGGAARVLTRRRLEMALGVLWLVDAALQWQPYMFSSAFFGNMLGMANMGLPGPVPAVLYQTTTMLAAHPVIWNAAFASLQLAIGAGLLWGCTAALARPVSIAWALAVWMVGEGFGGLFMPGVSALNGAPGAALLYALIALILWPRRPSDGPAVAVADTGLLGGRGALWCWTVLWSGLALLELGGANHAPASPRPRWPISGKASRGGWPGSTAMPGTCSQATAHCSPCSPRSSRLRSGGASCAPPGAAPPWRRASQSPSCTACSARIWAVCSPGRPPILVRRHYSFCSPWRYGPGGIPRPVRL